MEQINIEQGIELENNPNVEGNVQNPAEVQVDDNQTHWFSFDWKTEAWTYDGTDGRNLFGALQNN